MTTREWLDKAVAFLKKHGVPEAEASSEFLMAEVLKTGRSEIKLHHSRTLAVNQGNHFWHLILRRGKRLPLGYILGTQPFCGLDIQVTPEVLIPRPETEELVSAAIGLFKNRKDTALHLLEIGTGTGCISIALAQALPQALIFATDISPAALKLALKNAEAHHRARQIRFIKEDLFKPDAGRQGWADLVISNPPYIPSRELFRLEPEVQKEPPLALDGGPDGLRAVRAIVVEAAHYLKAGGWLVLEIGADQGAAARDLLGNAGFKEVEVRRDLQGHDRMALGKW